MGKFDKVNVRVAAPKKSLIKMAGHRLMTQDVFQLVPSFYRELVPDSKLKLDMSSFCRTTPLVKPALVDYKFYNRAFFVPFRTVWEPFTDFIVDSPHNTSEGTTFYPSVPLLSSYTLEDIFSDTANQLATYVQEGDHDFTAQIDSSNREYLKLTPRGRLVYKLLTSLGYKILWHRDRRSFDDVTFSALPLLCFAKAFIDYYYPQQYAKRGNYAVLEGIFQRQFTYTLSKEDTISLLTACLHSYYESDYFTGAFDSPVGPSVTGDTAVESSVIIRDVTTPTVNTSNVVSEFTNGTPVLTTLGGHGDEVSPVTQYQLDALKSLNDYVKRHQLVGSLALNRYLARYGKSLSVDQLKRSIYVGKIDYSLNIGEVQSHADSGDAVLGDYAGRAVAGSNGSFEFESNEFGMFIVISSIVPKVSYGQGVDRNVMHKSRLDFWTPEFDSLGNQPIAPMELLVDNNHQLYNTGCDKEIFGWSPRYSEYKCLDGLASVIGDFVIPTINLGLPSPWSSQRVIEITAGTEPDEIKHSLDFMRTSDREQFDRIFYSTSLGRVDCFYQIHHFDVDYYAPLHPLYDTYEFCDDAGKEITMDVNGSKVE